MHRLVPDSAQFSKGLPVGGLDEDVDDEIVVGTAVTPDVDHTAWLGGSLRREMDARRGDRQHQCVGRADETGEIHRGVEQCAGQRHRRIVTQHDLRTQSPRRLLMRINRPLEGPALHTPAAHEFVEGGWVQGRREG